MTIIQFKNFRYFVNGHLVSDEYARYRFERKRVAYQRLRMTKPTQLGYSGTTVNAN